MYVPEPPAGFPFNIKSTLAHTTAGSGLMVVVGFGSTVITTSSVVAAQPPKHVVMVHLNVEDAPIVSPVTPEVGLLMDVTTAVPEITDHVPVSLPKGTLAASVAVVVLQRF